MDFGDPMTLHQCHHQNTMSNFSIFPNCCVNHSDLMQACALTYDVN